MPATGWRLTVCGLDELREHGGREVSHVLSILDPGWPDPEGEFAAYAGHHRRLTLRFHDVIEDLPGHEPPGPGHVEAVLRLGADLDEEHGTGGAGEAAAGLALRHLLVHCHAGVSRSTAALAILLARKLPGEEAAVFARIREIRPQAWPNSRMVAFADDQLGSRGRLVAALRDHYRHQLRARPELAAGMRAMGRGAEVPDGAAG